MTELVVYEAPVPTEVVQYSTTVATELARVVKEQRLSTTIQGREYLTAEAWGAAGEMLDLSVRVDEPKPFTDSKGGLGYACRAHLYRPDGRELSTAVAICTRSETRWSRADDYALYSMSQTRAISKAYRSRLSFIAVLAGYEPTPAEEMPQPAAPVAAPQSDDEVVAAANARIDRANNAAPVAAPPSVEPEAAAPPAPATPVRLPTISVTQQKDLAKAAKAAKLTWPSLQSWMRESGIGDFAQQKDLTMDAWDRCIAFCNESSWAELGEDLGVPTELGS